MPWLNGVNQSSDFHPTTKMRKFSTLPEGEVSGELMSAWASIQTTLRSGYRLYIVWTVAMATEWSPPRFRTVSPGFNSVKLDDISRLSSFMWEVYASSEPRPSTLFITLSLKWFVTRLLFPSETSWAIELIIAGPYRTPCFLCPVHIGSTFTWIVLASCFSTFLQE